MRTTLYIGGWRLDQFADEAATVVSSVLDITDITKNTGDYTKTFTVPASKRNNILFKHWYDATIDNSFDARIKVDGRIDLDGITFKSGKFRLSKVAVRKNAPSSYTINFFGKLPSLKDIVKKDYLTDLDLSAFDHDYDSTNVELGLKAGLFDLDIIYTLLVKKQYYYNNDVTDNTQTETLANIAWGGGDATGIIWNDLRASLKLIRIIDAIEEKYNGKQKTTIQVIAPAVVGTGSCLLTLNGVQYDIPIFTTTTEGNALEIQVFANALPDYTATWIGDTVSIEAVETLPQDNTLWEVNTATGMNTIVTTTSKGNNGLRFSRDFFGTSEFDNLYMWLNPDKDKQAGGDINIIDWDNGDTTWMNLATDTGSYEIINEAGTSLDRYFEITCIIEPEVGFENVEYTIIAVKDGEEEMTSEHSGDDSQLVELLPQGQTSGTTHLMQWKVLSSEEFQYRATLLQQEFNTANPNVPIRSRQTFAGVNINESIFKVGEELPKMKIIDFLKGLFNMFKLVVIPQENGDYYVDTLNSFYSNGKVYDTTKYIDFESYDVERGVILNEIELKFKKPTTLLNIQFEKNNKRGYGDIEKPLTDDAGELLDGDSLIFELPFEQFVYERLTDQLDNSQTKIQYGAIIDEEREPASPSAHIHYASYASINGTPVSFIRDNGIRTMLNVNIWTAFHHSGITQPNYATIFKAEFSTWDGLAITNNLYSRHYDDYISTIFNVKKRTFRYEAQLPIHIITKLELNDILKIKEDYYRIDKYSYNLLTGKTSLNLINSFDNTIDPTRTQEESIYVDFRSQTETVLITNSDAVVPNKIDQGYGTSWVTLTSTGDNKHIEFDEHPDTIGGNRVMFLEYTSAGESVFVYLSQSDKGYIPSYIFSDSRNSQYIPII